jgi:transcription elongation factor Elf1
MSKTTVIPTKDAIIDAIFTCPECGDVMPMRMPLVEAETNRGSRFRCVRCKMPYQFRIKIEEGKIKQEVYSMWGDKHQEDVDQSRKDWLKEGNNSKIQYEEIDRFRMEPDIYAGEDMKQHKPRWVVSIPKEGDEYIYDKISFDPDNNIPGTLIIVKEPLCPKCGESHENCNIRNEHHHSCDFDWNEWVEHRYS